MPERWILSRLQVAAAEVDTALEAFRFTDAANAIYHFVWRRAVRLVHRAREAAPAPVDGAASRTARKAARRHLVQGVLSTVLETTMRLLHPFAPFVTEEIWQKLPKPQQLPESLMITVFPRADAEMASTRRPRPR